MYWKSSLFILTAIFFSCDEIVNEENESLNQDSVQSEFLIDAEELKRIYINEHIKVLDLCSKQNFQTEHINGAINITRTDIEDDNNPYSGRMISREQLEELFSQLGIRPQDTLILYDDKGLCEAARLWWILINYNFSNVRLLHGGMQAWKSIEGITSNEIAIYSTTNFKFQETPNLKYFASRENVIEGIKREVILLDVRSMDEHSGKRKKKGAKKAGRIPNSINIDWAESINFSADQKFKSINELKSIFSVLKNKRDHEIIVYCHSGVRSAHTTFVLTQLLGYGNVKNYDGSWLEWSSYDELNFESDY